MNVKKVLDPKDLGTTNLRLKIILKKLVPKNLGPKIFFVQKNLGPRNILFKSIFGPTNLGPQK